LDAEILTGACKGTKVFVPRIKLAPSDAKLAFILERIQFPIRVSYSMTINKSGGQTFDKSELYLRSQVFSYGQLHVAFQGPVLSNKFFLMIVSATTHGVFVGQAVTQNVGYKEVL